MRSWSCASFIHPLYVVPWNIGQLEVPGPIRHGAPDNSLKPVMKLGVQRADREICAPGGDGARPSGSAGRWVRMVDGLLRALALGRSLLVVQQRRREVAKTGRGGG